MWGKNEDHSAEGLQWSREQRRQGRHGYDDDTSKTAGTSPIGTRVSVSEVWSLIYERKRWAGARPLRQGFQGCKGKASPSRVY